MKATESVLLLLEWKPNVNYSSRSIFDLFNFPLNSQLNLMMLLINVRHHWKSDDNNHIFETFTISNDLLFTSQRINNLAHRLWMLINELIQSKIPFSNFMKMWKSKKLTNKKGVLVANDFSRLLFEQLSKQQVQFLNSLFVKCRLKSIKYRVTVCQTLIFQMRLNSITQPPCLAHSLSRKTANYSMRYKLVIEFDIVLQRICNEYVSLIAFPNIDKLIERHNRFRIQRHYSYAFSLLYGRQVNAFIIHTFTSDQFIIRIKFHIVLSFLNASSFRQFHSTKKIKI